MNDANRAVIADMLKNGATAAAISAKLPDVSEGKIAAIAESEGLTQAHAKPDASPILDIDPQLALALAALAWGENNHSAQIRNLAKRTRAGLTELQQYRRNATEAEKAKAEVAKAAQALENAQAKLRNFTASSGPGLAADAKRQRAQIRTWARANGHKVSNGGVIPKAIMDAWNKHRSTVPAQRRAR
ncbi:Lsr2 family protein (plasmid) [Streptomyces sp. NBC_01527]|uniref:Lsr2 family DNA-binding protein n=1 Tax=Streptomyces sp. NBC_01527 TaxID=2903894 RepID=UPI002F9069D4